MGKDFENPCETLAERYQALMEVAEAISVHKSLHELFRELAHRLPRVVHVNFVALSLHDPEHNVMRLHTIQANVPADLVGGHEGSVEESPAGLVWQTQHPVLVSDLTEECRWPQVIQCMKEDGANSFCFVPLTTAVRRLGAMGFLSLQKGAYDETDVEFFQEVGKQIAVAVDNVLHHQELTHDRDRLRLLLEVSEAIVLHRALPSLFRDLAQRLPAIAPFDFIGLILHDPTKNLMRVHVLETAAAHPLVSKLDGLELPVEESFSRRGEAIHDGDGGTQRSRSPIRLSVSLDDCHATTWSDWIRESGTPCIWKQEPGVARSGGQTGCCGSG